MGTERAAPAALTAQQVMDFWLWLWLGFTGREAALAQPASSPGGREAPAALEAELAALEALSSRLSAELTAPPPGAPAGRTSTRLGGGLGAASLARLESWLARGEPAHDARLLRRATEVLRQVRRAPPPTPARAAAVELWAWLTGAEADRRKVLAAAGHDRRAARQLADELKLLQTVQGGVRRGQPDVIPSHPHEGAWLGARQPLQLAAAAELAAALRQAHPGVSAGRGGSRLGQLVDAIAARLEAVAGSHLVAALRAEAAASGAVARMREKIAAGLSAAEGKEPRRATARFLGKAVAADPSRLGLAVVDADLGDQAAWRGLLTPNGFDEAAEFSAAGAVAYELFLLVDSGGALASLHLRIDRSPHGQRWFAPVPAPRWLRPQGATLDVAWEDVAAPARARVLALLAALTSGAPAPSSVAPGPLPGEALAAVMRRARRSRH